MATNNTNTTTNRVFTMSANARKAAGNSGDFWMRGQLDLAEVETNFGIRIQVTYYQPANESQAKINMLIPPRDFAILEAKCGGEIDLNFDWEIRRSIRRKEDGSMDTWVNSNGEVCKAYDYTIRKLS